MPVAITRYIKSLFILLLIPFFAITQKNNSADTSQIKELIQRGRSFVYNHPDSCLLLCSTALNLSRKINYQKGELSALNLLCSFYEVTGNYPKSLEFGQQSLKLAESLNNSFEIAKSNSAIGNVYDDLNELRQALAYKLHAKKLLESSHDEKGLTNVLLGIGDTYEMLNKLDSARVFTQQAYELCLKYNVESTGSIALNNLGNIHYKMALYPLAMDYYRLSMKEYLKLDDEEGISDVALGMAKIFQTQKQADSALYYAHLSLRYATANGFTRYILSSANFLSDHFQKQKNIDSLYAYQQIIMAAKDSLFSQEKVKEVQDLSFAEAQRQQELAELKEKEREERKNNLQLTGIAIFVILFLLTCLLFVKKKASSKLVRFAGVLALLLLFEFISLLLHPYVERFTNHTPVFMLILLVAAAAVLVPLHHYLEEWFKTKLKTVRKRKNKRTVVRSMPANETKQKK